MDQLSTSIMLATSSHRLKGQVVTAGQRLLDILNNKLSTCVSLQGVTGFRHTDADIAAIHLPTVTVPKPLINLLFLQEQTHEAPTSRLYGFVQKDSYPTFLTVAGYEVKGHLHFTSPPKPELFLTDTLTSFVPVSQATVTCAGNSSLSWETPVVFVQRTAIALFYLSERP
jgi:hypothetical protein